ncbi:hypothetical protein CPB83DRAFT_895280 [Crepidotus variabilis]|uniref:Uncharacterized protein n=1 Tax=Crepidotus variabilis TaxID=179855 RepID=A0A9P6JPD3_9AGAR|nr:hypothetical protein CPB83DRAFT_895280 [Crepidotus variabilis]
MNSGYFDTHPTRGPWKGKGKESTVPTKPYNHYAPHKHSVHGPGFCDGSCQPGPSCALFPRRPDGKVILPDPRGFSKYGNKPSSHTTTWNRTAPPETERPSRRYHADRWEVKTPEPEVSVPQHLVGNYAQLSTMPAFKAFRMDQEEGLAEGRGEGLPMKAPSSEGDSPVEQSDSQASAVQNAEWHQWKMREIRVMRRRRKQEYIRSGTHDFCIRLWAKNET